MDGTHGDTEEETAMEAKERKHTTLGKLRWPAYTGASRTALMRWADGGIHFLLGAVLAGGVVFGQVAPFGVALVGAAGSGACGGAALVGAVFGYLTPMGFADGLRYVSAAILTFAVQFAFYDVKLLHRPWAMPLIAGAINGCTGFIYLSEGGWRTVDVICYLMELGLTAAACWCYRQLLLPIRMGRADRVLSTEKQVSLTVLVCTVLISLSSLYLIKDVSVGRSLAVAVVLAGAWQGGGAPGAVLGIAVGASMDLAANDIPVYALAYGVAGLAAGAFVGGARLKAAVAYVIANSAAVLWMWDHGLPLSILYEAFLGSMAFLLLPQRPMSRLGHWLKPDRVAGVSPHTQAKVRRQLEASAQAFRTLYESMRSAFRGPQNDNDVAAVFDRAACRVCKTCSLRSDCWERNYVTTFNALNDATQAMVERGRGEAGDFPQYFASRCVRFPAFLEAVNGELTALLYRRQYNSRIRESRQAVCRQYGELADLLGAAAAEMSRELTPDVTQSAPLQRYLAALDGELRGGAFRDGRGRLRVEIEGPGAETLGGAEALAGVLALFPVPLRVEEQAEGRLSLLQQEPLMAVAGVAAKKKDGETVSGDGGTYFKREDGTLYVLLCDGMGSGPLANRESSLALRLLEQFLQAGVDTEHALNTLNAALALRGEDGGGFTTVDLLQLDLFTGDGVIFKFGAAPSYIRKGETVRRISGSSMPAGLVEGGRGGPDRTPIHLSPGDYVLLVSDGVAGAGDDQWIRTRLAGFSGGSPKELAKDLILHSPQDATDDRTALVVRLERREA